MSWLAAAVVVAGLSFSADVAMAQAKPAISKEASTQKGKSEDPCKQFKADSKEHKDCVAKHAADEKAKKPGTKKP
jgi:hypothetical protein